MCYVFIAFDCSHDTVFKLYCWSEFFFEILPFSNIPGKSMCRFHVNWRPVITIDMETDESAARKYYFRLFCEDLYSL